MPLKRLRELCDMSRSGVSIQELASGLQKLHIHSRAVKLPMEEAVRMPLPAIVFWNQNHFVVLHKVSKDGKYFHIADPAKGNIKVPADDFHKSWCGNAGHGIAVLTEPTDDFKAGKEPDKRHRGLIAMGAETIRRHGWRFAAVLLLAVIGMCADVALPLLLQHTVDEGIANKNISLVWMLALSQLCVFAGYYLTSSLSEYVLTRLGLSMGIDMMNRYLCKLIRLPMDFFERKVKSDLIQKTEDQNRIKEFLLSFPRTTLFALLSLVVFSVLLIHYSVLIFTIFTGMTLVGVAWSTGFLARRKSIDHSLSACASENRNNLYELVHGMSEIKSNNAENVRLGKWRKVQEESNRLAMKSYFLRFFIGSGQNLITQLRDITVTGLCATLVINGKMSLGGMMTVSYIAGRLAQPFSTLVSSIFSVQDATTSYERVDEILNAPDAPADRLKHFSHGDICLREVDFKYPGAASPYILRNINLTVRRGDTVAFVGPSGCGKSTLVKLILGLHKPTSGSVFSGHTSLEDIDSSAWLACCSIVMQSGTVFSGTIAENIALSEENPDMERVREAATIACLDEFVKTLPMTYDTRLGVAGMELSGGQVQRLLIARAVYKAPEIIILDEATSSLDAANESRIVGNIQAFKGGRTLIVAAHRLSTIRHADVIHYIDNGQITESGSHDSLMALGGAYARLINGQLSETVANTTYAE